MQDVFFSTQMAEPSSSKWLGGPQVLLQGTLNDTNTNVIVIMNACVSLSPSHCGPPSCRSRSHRPALSSHYPWSKMCLLHKVSCAEGAFLFGSMLGRCICHARDRSVDVKAPL